MASTTIAVNVRSGYTPISGICYPIDIQNTGSADANIVISATNTTLTNNTINIPVGNTATVYAATFATADMISFTYNGGTEYLNITTLEQQSIQYGDPSAISVFMLPGGTTMDILPKLENIHLLMRAGKYFKAPGQVKIWREDAL